MFKRSLLVYSSSVAFRVKGLWIEIQNHHYRTFLATDCHCVTCYCLRVPKFGSVF